MKSARTEIGSRAAIAEGDRSPQLSKITHKMFKKGPLTSVLKSLLSSLKPGDFNSDLPKNRMGRQATNNGCRKSKASNE